MGDDFEENVQALLEELRALPRGVSFSYEPDPVVLEALRRLQLERGEGR